jgi:hypothetical protein
VVAARAIRWSGQRKFVQASGAVEYFPGLYLPGALAAAALATLLGASAGRVRWHWGDALLVLALIGASVIAVELSLYLDWTNVGGAQIIGVQGRYYLLLVPFALLVVPRFGAWFDRGTGWRYGRDAASVLLTLPAILVALKTALVLPTLIARSFYQ